MLATDTGPAHQFRDAHGAVLSIAMPPRLPTKRQRRSRTGLMRDFRAIAARTNAEGNHADR